MMSNSLITKIQFYNVLFVSLSCVALVLPILSYVLFVEGINIKHHEINVYVYFVICIVIIFKLHISNNFINLKILVFSIIVLFLISFLSTLLSSFGVVNIIDLTGLYIGLLSPIIIGIGFYLNDRYRYNFNIYQFIFLSGILISTINIYLFIKLYLGDYTNVYNYTVYLGLKSYFSAGESFFIRPAGYFFDYHSQYFIPLISIIIINENKICLNKPVKYLCSVLFLLSIIISGIKTAYITLIILLLYYLFRKNTNKFLYFFFLTPFLFLLNNYTNNLFYDILFKIINHDLEIIFEHFISVPHKLFTNYPLIFLFGGHIDMAATIYSEVYLLTLIFYLGVFGLFSYFIVPAIAVFNQKSTFAKAIIIIFILSLMHYYVYRIGINAHASALVYYLLFKNGFKN